jgi:hypothetical protein
MHDACLLSKVIAPSAGSEFTLLCDMTYDLKNSHEEEPPLDRILKPEEGRTMFNIADVSFLVTKAHFGGFLDAEAGLLWTFDVRTAPNREVPIEHRLWSMEPRFYAEALPIDIDNVAHLAETVVTVPEEVSEETGEPLFDLYVFEHEPAWEVKIAFGERSGSKYWANCQAKASLLGEEVVVAIDEWIEFTGISCPLSDEAEARAALNRYTDVRTLVAHVSPQRGLVFRFE